MFTLFNEELNRFARDTLRAHREFEAGKWTSERLAAHQLDQLRDVLRYTRDNSPFYGERLAGLSDERIGRFALGDLGDLPFTTKDDLRQNMLGTASQPVTDSWVFYETTGTTGPATPCPRNNVDSIVNNTVLSLCYDTVLRRHDGPHLVAVMGPTELHSTGDTFGDVFRNLGHTVAKMWPHSPVVGYRRALQLLREMPFTGLVCTPGMAMALAKEARRAGLDPRRDLSVSFLLLVGELLTPALAANIGSLWDATAYNSMYASQEASILAAVRDDELLHTAPLNVCYEVIDPNSGTPVQAGPDGAVQGELVITHLYRGSKPLIRYRTGDMVVMRPAGTGASYPSPLLRPLGRVRDRLTLNGNTVHAFDLEQLVLGRLTGCQGYQVVIDRIEGVDTLTVLLETADFADRSGTGTGALRADLMERFGTPAEIRFTDDLGAITTTGAMVSWKAARIHDRRTAEPEAERLAALAIAGQREVR
ncbi:phenylacetate--CoA ligase family protein [Streptomyces sp. TRM 70361]|uniref:phenylacetate--CoA ligase family protein n=1 Tax=Streptomyces sp. TRM 70361 TaxID=3116553 RepID=UPI002E7C1F24|nr:phenylacetate--CoA ligase family protein [Streptomyces sp. TRM 70361]MEE1938783.1 phenylacetate--CoA ligase family protein [Streptomyces sp. TRM 70361]